MTLQDLIFKLSQFWASQGCLLHQPLDIEVGAGTSSPETVLRVLGPRRVAYLGALEESRVGWFSMLFIAFKVPMCIPAFEEAAIDTTEDDGGVLVASAFGIRTIHPAALVAAGAPLSPSAAARRARSSPATAMRTSRTTGSVPSEWPR